jgi:deazaflavin-dependent oxidoreductase (nitroreductase family)
MCAGAMPYHRIHGGSDMAANGHRSPSPDHPVKNRISLAVEHYGNKWLRPVGRYLIRRTQGRIAPGDREVMLLTTRGRKSGRKHTVLLQYFHDGDDLTVVAANEGRSTHPDWYHNLMAAKTATAEAKGQTFEVRPERVAADEAEDLWPSILERAPTYVRYLNATSREIPLVRLHPLDVGSEEIPHRSR